MARKRKRRLGNFVYRAPSKIHGNGLFAKTPITKGDYIGTYEGPTAKRDGTYVLWVFEEAKNPVGRSGRNLLRYLNHQDRGNAEFDGFDLYALQDIEPHQEITFDYGGWEES
ncbi:MAG: SET domain-containing protein-lysine N-methyltransferase [Candidatus Thiodiazotropha sp. (ex Dulcina madagascariensis)]|nr:SET domain-containing protein-lysine N-methyltransferase [Candidatus Thiodiazotropha sp. (ex Dulcina madagascariensis)]